MKLNQWHPNDTVILASKRDFLYNIVNCFEKIILIL